MFLVYNVWPYYAIRDRGSTLIASTVITNVDACAMGVFAKFWYDFFATRIGGERQIYNDGYGDSHGDFTV